MQRNDTATVFPCDFRNYAFHICFAVTGRTHELCSAVATIYLQLFQRIF